MLAPPVAVTVMVNVPAGTFDGSAATIWLLLADTKLSFVLLNTTVGATLVGSNPEPTSVTRFAR